MVMEQLSGRRTCSTCIGCGGLIQDQYILRVAPDLEWHAACLRCIECCQLLDDKCTCFVRNGKTYCKSDYVRLFGAKCNRCSKNFSSKDLVMRAKDKIFHVDCFRCKVCCRHLVPGDEFALRDDSIYCRDDFQCTFPCKKETTEHMSTSPGCGEDNVLLKMDKDSKRTEGKPTRVRTVLTEKQLHTLRTCYNANPRPDALMKEQMVEMTNLSPRVIRVWFQNKRCKDKKREIYLRQIQEASKDGRQMGGLMPLQGVHMIAAPPVRHGMANGAEPCGEAVDITSYQPPWKMLHELAQQGDLDPSSPQYQSLFNQMHGYGVPCRTPDVSLPSDGRTAACASSRGSGGVKYELDNGSDSYVSYLESDDSLNTASP